MAKDCIKRMVELSDGKIDEAQARQLFNDIVKEVKRKTNKGDDFNDAVRAVVNQKKETSDINRLLQKRNQQINIVKQKEIVNRLDQSIAEGQSPRKALESLLVGTQSNVVNARLSVDARMNATRAKFLGDFVSKMEAEDLLPIITQKVMRKEIARELFEISNVTGRSVTGSKQARRIAEIINESFEATRLRQNQAGADIGKLDNFLGVQTHNMARLRRAGKAKWLETVLPLLDRERTFGNADPDEFLDEAYKGLVTGIHLRAALADDKLFQFKGPANLAKKISQERKLHFKSADAWLAYNNAFGSSDFLEGVIRTISKASRNIALLETFGTNPRAMFDKIVSDLGDRFRDQPKEVSKILGGQNRPVRALNNFFDELDGSVNIPENLTLSQIGAGIRAFNNVTKLGGAVVSAFADLPLVAREFNFQGMGSFQSYARSVQNLFEGLGSKDRKALARSLGTGIDGIVGNMAARFSATDDLPGRVAKIQRLFFKMNALEWWTETHKIGSSIAMSNLLADSRNLSFKSVNSDLRRVLGNFGILENEWNVIRRAATKLDDGNTYITPDAVAEVPDDIVIASAKKVLGVEEVSAKQLSDFRASLEDKLRSYFADRVSFAVIEPSARERALIKQGTRPGTVQGELLRFLGQFKGFPLTMITKIWGRALFAKGKADVPELATLLSMMTLFGYAAMTAKDVLRGQKPRDPTNPKTWLAAFIQGGGAGIYGDFLYGASDRFGKSLALTVAGPTAGLVDDVAALSVSTAKAVVGAKEGKKAAAQNLKIITNNIPFLGLFYVRGAFNYLVGYHMQEMTNPGYLKRMEKRLEKDQGRRFFISPSSIVNR